MTELLAPVGNPEVLDAAINEGADAVYLGLRSFNARMRSANFAFRQFEAAADALHKRGKKVYVTVNTVIEESELERMYRFLKYLAEVGPDAIIVQDFGVVRMVQEFFPSLKIHASTQMNVASAEGANLLLEEGIKRVVLSRELGLDEVRSVAENTKAELEVFVHGALCVCESGLCLFSSFLGGKSANRGQCAQACRRLYTADTMRGEISGYYFSPYDLQLVDFVPDLVRAGVASLKIEGRMKSAEYVAQVTAAYRHLLDNFESDKKGAIATAKRLLSGDFAREKTAYWYKSDSCENVLNPAQSGGTGISLGCALFVKSQKMQDGETMRFASLSGNAETLEVGDTIRIHKKDDSQRISHKIRSIFDDGKRTLINVPPECAEGDAVYLLQTKDMSKRYPHIVGNLSGYRKQPGDAKLPVLDLDSAPKSLRDFFPAGLYAQVSTVRDLVAVLSENPVRVILELTDDSRQNLVVRQKSVPAAKSRVIISLDPFLPQASANSLKEEVECLFAQGFQTFVANNLAHIPILKRLGANIIAGPYLYTFNRWAVSFLENQDLSAICAPLESNGKNLGAIFSPKERERVLVSVFAYPALFRMRFKLGEEHDFTYFWDKQSTVFKALSTPDGSFVLPENPYSIVDKVVQLESDGFSRFLVDFSKTAVGKGDFKAIIRAMTARQPLPETSRFNWKEGFYDAEKIERFKEISARNAEKGAAKRGKSRNFRKR